MTRLYNRYDFFLFILISSVVFGMIGNGAQPARLLTLSVFPFMLRDAFKGKHRSIWYYRFECFFLFFWWLWALSFFFKAVDATESGKHLAFLLIHIIGFFEILWASCKALQPQRAIQYGWMFFMILSLPVAVYEFLTDFHLPMSVYDSGTTIEYNGIKIERPFASVTFGNLNTYNTTLCWALPSLFMCNLYPRNKFDKFLGFSVLACVSLIIIANASRGAILCLGLLIATYVICYYKTGRNRTLLIIVLVLAAVVLVYYLGDLFLLIIERFANQGVEDDGRTENLVKGFQAFCDSYGLGIGIGNYEPIMGNVYRVQFAAPHNLFLEVLTCYGAFVFVGFVIMFLGLLIRCWTKGDMINRDMMFFCCVSLLFAGMIDSQYLMKVPTWFFIATMYVYLDSRYNKQKCL